MSKNPKTILFQFLSLESKKIKGTSKKIETEGFGLISGNPERAAPPNPTPPSLLAHHVPLFAAMLVYRTGRSRPKKSLKLVHASLHLAAFVFSVVGLKAAFDSHDLAVPSRPNLYTLHSWVGLIAVVLFAGQLAFGFAAFLYPGLSPGLRAALLPVHAHLGAAIFAAAVAAALLGILEKNIFAL